MYGLVQYRLMGNFSHACNGNLTATVLGESTVYDGIECHSRAAWKLADGKYGNDGKTVSVVVGCLARNSTNALFCKSLESSAMDMKLTLRGQEADRNDTVFERSVVVVDIKAPSLLDRLKESRVSKSSLLDKNYTEPEDISSKFSLIPGRNETKLYIAVCAVQTNRNPLSPYQMHMFVAHYLSLGFHVIIYDRFGLHKEFIDEFLPNKRFDYHPYTLLEVAWPASVNRIVSMDFSYKLYYTKESDSVAQKTPVVQDTLMQDRDKMSTLDHATVEYSVFSDIQGILFVDIDEYLFCPSKAESIAEQVKHISSIIDKLLKHNKEELRVDVHPYAAAKSASGSIQDLELCFKNGYLKKGAKSSLYLHQMHTCFSGLSTYQMWPKSLDFKRRCPFHYNHWSCDGGRGGGRQLGCYCRVSFEWYSKMKSKSTPECHLLHYNHHIFTFQDHRRHHNHHQHSDQAKQSHQVTIDSPLAVLYV
jgi:hypothetical protein